MPSELLYEKHSCTIKFPERMPLVNHTRSYYSRLKIQTSFYFSKLQALFYNDTKNSRCRFTIRQITAEQKNKFRINSIKDNSKHFCIYSQKRRRSGGRGLQSPFVGQKSTTFGQLFLFNFTHSGKNVTAPPPNL